MARKKIGQILMEHGWLSMSQLTQALQHQQFFGGRLGSCLMELNLISEKQLVQGLSEQSTVEPIGFDDLRNVPKSALDLIPGRMAGKSKVICFEMYGTEASVAMMNPNDLLLQDELAFVVGKRLKIRVAPEVRILEALEKYYSWDVDSRFSRIWDRLNRARYLWQEETQAGTAPVSAPAASPDLAAPAGPAKSATFEMAPPPHLETEASEEVLRTAEGRPVTGSEIGMRPPPMPPAPSRPAVPPEPVVVKPAPKAPSLPPAESIEQLEERLGAVGERDHIARQVLDYLRRDFERVLIFMVRGGEVAGWMGEGADVEQTLFQNFEQGFEQPSMFLNLREGSPFYRGPLLQMEAHIHLCRIWGGTFPKEALLLPVRLRDRLVTILYCDNGAEGLGVLDLREFQNVAQLTGQAFEGFLVRKKKQHH